MPVRTRSLTTPPSAVEPRTAASPERSTSTSKRAGYALAGLASVVFVILRLWDLTGYDLNGAETFMLDGVRMSWRGLLQYMIADMVHAPLTYVLLRGWIAIGGESLLWLKLFSATAGIAAIVPFFLVCRELRLELREVNLALILAAVNAYLIHHAQEMRMYSVLLFFAMCSAWLFLRYVNSRDTGPRTLVPLTVANVLLVYTHYFGWMLVASQLAVLLFRDRQRLRGLLASTLVVGVVFLPWAILVVLQFLETGSTLDWIPRPSLDQAAEFYGNLNGLWLWPGTGKIGLLLCGVPVLAFMVKLARGRAGSLAQRTPFWFLVVASFGSVAAVFLASWIMPDSFWFDRYFIYMSMLYLILVSVSVWRVGPDPLGWILAGLVLSWAVAVGANDIRTSRFATREIASRVKWSDAARHLINAEEGGDAGDPVAIYALPVWSQSQRRVTGDWTISTSLRFHLNELGYTAYRLSSQRGLRRLAVSDPPDRFWVVTVASHEGSRGVREQLTSWGYEVDHEFATRAGLDSLVLLHARRAAGDTLDVAR